MPRQLSPRTFGACFLGRNQGELVIPHISSNNDALRALLERLFPDIEISETGVSLLAVQMAQMENLPRPLDDSVLSREAIEIAARATRLSIMFPYPIGRMINYGSDNSE